MREVSRPAHAFLRSGHVMKLFEVAKGAKNAPDTLATAMVYRQIQAWHQQYGERWAPAPLLRRLAETGTPLRDAKPGGGAR